MVVRYFRARYFTARYFQNGFLGGAAGVVISTVIDWLTPARRRGRR